MNQVQEKNRKSSWKILVVNHRASIPESLYGLLGLWGHHVQQVATSADAVALASSFMPGLILIDMEASGINGYEVAQCLRRDRASHKALLVALTYPSRREADHLLIRAGFDYYLEKPLKAATLINLLDRL